jgi:tol-pal system protein YbgF
MLLSGCLAMQSDIQKVDSKIAKLDQRDKELQAAVKQAKTEIDKLVNETRARLSQEITVLRDEDLPGIRGALDKEAHQIVSVRNRLDNLEEQTAKRSAAQVLAEKEQAEALQRAEAERRQLQEDFGKLGVRLEAMTTAVGGMVKTLGTRLDEQDKMLHTDEARTGALTQQLDAQTKTVTDQMSQISRALSEFKQALHGLGERLIQGEQATHAQTVQLVRRLEDVQSKVESSAKATAAHLGEQDRRLDELTTALQSVTVQVKTLREASATSRTPKGARGQKRAASEGDTTANTVEPQTHASLPPAPDSNAPSDPSGRMSEGQGKDSAKEHYDRTLQKFKNGDLEGAAQGFTEFVGTFPTSSLAPNAQYWLGECYYGRKDYQRAIEAFERVQAVYPRSGKVPAAMLKKGFAHLALKDRNQAVTVLQQVMDSYPQSAEAKKAADKLAQLR